MNWQVRKWLPGKSQDGTEINGVLITPADFDPSLKYPLFVVIHGGPTGISRPSKFIGSNRYYPIEQFLCQGRGRTDAQLPGFSRFWRGFQVP